SLQGLEPVVLLRPVRLLDSLGALVAQEVHVDAFVPRWGCGPKVPYPLALLGESGTRLRAGADVVGEAGRAAVERGLVITHSAHGAAHVPDRVRRQRRGDLQRVLRRDVDDFIAQLGDVAALEV